MSPETDQDSPYSSEDGLTGWEDQTPNNSSSKYVKIVLAFILVIAAVIFVISEIFDPKWAIIMVAAIIALSAIFANNNQDYVRNLGSPEKTDDQE